MVETKAKKRVVVTAKPGAPAPGPSPTVVAGDPSRRPAGLTDAELERRMKALAAARAREAEEAQTRAAEEAARAEERERRRAEIEAKEREEKERAEAVR